MRARLAVLPGGLFDDTVADLLAKTAFRGTFVELRPLAQYAILWFAMLAARNDLATHDFLCRTFALLAIAFGLYLNFPRTLCELLLVTNFLPELLKIFLLIILFSR